MDSLLLFLCVLALLSLAYLMKELTRLRNEVNTWKDTAYMATEKYNDLLTKDYKKTEEIFQKVYHQVKLNQESSQWSAFQNQKD